VEVDRFSADDEAQPAVKRFFVWYGRFVGERPVIALVSVAALTVLAVIGLALTEEQAEETEAFLPDGSDLIAAQVDLARSFPDSAGLEAVQVVFRGDVLSPTGAAETRRTTLAVAQSPDLQPFAVAARPSTSPGHVLSVLLAGPDGDPATVDLESLQQGAIDTAVERARSNPDAVALVDALDSLVATDADGVVVGGIGVVTVRAGDDASALETAQLAVDELIDDTGFTALDSARTISPGKSGQESDDASSSSLILLMGLAFVVIAGLLALFYRQVTDVALSLAGLIITIVWALGFQGLLGPGGIGVIGAPSVLATMVPVMMIGLCVDYGIQGTSRYREACADGSSATEGISRAVEGLMLPLGLAGGTTIISFLTNLFGEISGLADFGVVAAVGVASGLYVFLTGIPAARVLVDRRREARGRPLETRRMDQAIPGAGAVVERISANTVRRPALILVVTGVVTIVLGGFASNLESSFSSNDFLPDGSETKDDVLFLDEFLGGNTEPVTVLIEADITDDRTLRNMLDFSNAIEDPVQRPDAVSSPVKASLGTVFNAVSASTESDLAGLMVQRQNPLVLPPETVAAGLEIVRSADPDGFDAVVAYGSGDEPDRTIIQFDALTGDTQRTRELFAQVDQLWFGDPAEVTPIANEILSLEVTDSLTESQTTSILLTILAALMVLVIFFWFTEFRPMLAVLAVLPILLVLVWVLGTMVLLGYDYNVVTALITALSIGIGVDYTIHITHRFLEEREHQHDVGAAMAATMRTTGGALIGSAITTALGFAVLVFSPIPPMGQFGLLTAITVTYSLIAAIVVLPPMLVIWAAYHDWRSANL
jgi:hydrophobe/amphiphile efflux-3 (HAE3) family protein